MSQEDSFQCPNCGVSGSVQDADEVDCPMCRGTGIGQHGDPDTSRCTYPECIRGVVSVDPYLICTECDHAFRVVDIE